MSILKVARMGHPVLRAKARALETADLKSAAVQKLIDDMIDTMVEYHGVGVGGEGFLYATRIAAWHVEVTPDGQVRDLHITPSAFSSSNRSLSIPSSP